MNESFELPVNYKAEKFAFPARLYRYGYSHRIEVMVHGHAIIFEPDEERNYRAVVSPEQYKEVEKKIDSSILEAIIESIESLVK